MKIFELYAILDEIAPFLTQESWDNSGLILGSMSSDVGRVYASLDVDSNLIDEIEPNSTLLTHHPLIFRGLKQLDTSIYPVNLIAKMLGKRINLISLHTNFDKALLNKYVAQNVLGFNVSDAGDFLLRLDYSGEFDSLVKTLKQRLGLDKLRVVKAKNIVKEVFFCTGSGSELINSAQMDCFITGDLKYHTALEAYENGINLIDIGHFESERYFGECMAKALQKFQIEVIIKHSKNPFSYL